MPRGHEQISKTHEVWEGSFKFICQRKIPIPWLRISISEMNHQAILPKTFKTIVSIHKWAAKEDKWKPCIFMILCMFEFQSAWGSKASANIVLKTSMQVGSLLKKILKSRLFVRSRLSDSWIQENAMGPFEKRQWNISRRRLSEPTTAWFWECWVR